MRRLSFPFPLLVTLAANLFNLILGVAFGGPFRHAAAPVAAAAPRAPAAPRTRTLAPRSRPATPPTEHSGTSRATSAVLPTAAHAALAGVRTQDA